MFLKKVFSKISSIKRTLFFRKNNIIFTPRTLKESNARNVNVKYLALVGLPRTGTSIFLDALNKNDDFFLLYESIISPFLVFKNKEIINSYFYSFLKQSHHLHANPIKKPPYSQEYKYFGDKVIFNSAGRVHSLFKKAIQEKIDKTIFIVRDPRATYLSYKKWMDKRNKIYVNTEKVTATSLEVQMKKWNEYIDFVNNYKNNNTKVLIVRYEDLVTNELKELDRINAFLEYDPDFKNEKIMRDSSILSWEKELSEEEKTIINKLAGSRLHSFNYI